MSSKRRNLLILFALLVPCVWLVQRNFFGAGAQASAGRAANQPSPQDQILATTAGGDSKAAAEQRQQISDVDPTLRLDLLKASRAVEYKGTLRNIFEAYTPPPPPPPPKPLTPPPNPDIATVPPSPPKPPPIPLKFYGIAQESGKPRRAFLTDGEEIMIASEGQTVGKFYRVKRIGVTSLEIEDTRTQQSQTLPLLEE
jgi:hypothetical protein